MTLKFDEWPWKSIGHLFYAISSFVHHSGAPFHSHQWNQTRVTVWKSPIWVKIDDFMKFDRWPWKTIGHLFYATPSFVHHFVAIGVYKLELKSGNAQFGSKSMIFVLCDLEIWLMTLKNNRAPLICHIKLCASFHRHMWIQTGVTVRKQLNWVLTSVTLTFDLDLLHGHHFCQW